MPGALLGKNGEPLQAFAGSNKCSWPKVIFQFTALAIFWQYRNIQ
jgi:hypothetical protein